MTANPCPTCGYQIDRVERLNVDNVRLRAALTEANKYVAEDMALNSPRSDGKDAKVLATIRSALNK
jgi:hypothetical protein